MLILSNQLLHRVSVMMFNATFNNISVISWRSVLLLEETGENHLPVRGHWQTLSHSSMSTPWQIGIQTHNVSGDGHILYMISNNFINDGVSELSFHFSVNAHRNLHSYVHVIYVLWQFVKKLVQGFLWWSPCGNMRF